MRRLIVLAGLCALLADMAFAADGLTPDAIGAGGSQDWIDRGNGAESIRQLAVSFAYDIVLSEQGHFGLSFWQLISAAPGTDGSNENDWISESSVTGWRSLFDAQLEIFGGGSLVQWGANVTGKAETLGGPLGGLRAPIEWEDKDGDGVEESPILWMEARGKYYFGQDGKAQWGFNIAPTFTIGS